MPGACLDVIRPRRVRPGRGDRTPCRSRGRGADRTLENDQSRWASREAGCPLLRDVRRVMRLVISVIAAQVISDSDSLN
jgi:hypothetical protein